MTNEVTLGRSPTCSVSLDDDAFVSSVHARIFVHDGEAFVEDLNSKNGTYLNEEPVTTTRSLNVVTSSGLVALSSKFDVETSCLAHYVLKALCSFGN